MFEARLVPGSLLKKIVEAIRDLVNDANVDCAETGITMQVGSARWRGPRPRARATSREYTRH